MTAPVQLKRSSVAGKIPVAYDSGSTDPQTNSLRPGEVAINTTDNLLYIGVASGVECVNAPRVVDDQSMSIDWSSGQGVITTSKKFAALSTAVYINGSRLKRGTDYTEGSDKQTISLLGTIGSATESQNSPIIVDYTVVIV